MKRVRIISTFLGISVFVFGILKFIYPIKSWYSVQIMNSGMSEFSYWLGITSEIFVGLLFLGSVIIRERLSKKTFSIMIIAASSMLVVIMATAIRVHLHPDVPAEVLPLKIKPPIIPGFLLLLAISDIILTRRTGLRKDV